VVTFKRTATAGHVIQFVAARRGIPIFSSWSRNPVHCFCSSGRSSSVADRMLTKTPLTWQDRSSSGRPKTTAACPLDSKSARTRPRRDFRHVTDQVRSTSLHLRGHRTSAVRTQVLVAGADVNSHALLEEGGQFRADHRLSISADRKLLRFRKES